MEPTIDVTVDGRPAISVAQLAAARGLTLEGARKIINRAKLKPAAQLGYVYDQADVMAAANDRPGKGGKGIPRPHRAKTGNA